MELIKNHIIKNINWITETTSKTIPLLFTVMTMFIASGCTNSIIGQEKDNSSEFTEPEVYVNDNRLWDTFITWDEIVPNPTPE